MTTSKNRVWALMALVVMIAGFSSCLKTNDITPQRDRAVVTILNGILTAESLDFYDNGTKANSSGLTLGFVFAPYYIYGGLRTFTFKRAGQTGDYVSDSRNYDSLTYNTLVAYGDSTLPQIRSIKEDFAGVKEQAVNIRFFHLSPNTPPVDVYVDDQKVDSNQAYVGTRGFITSFKPLAKTPFTNNIKIKLAGTDSLLASNSSPISTFQPNGAYTIYLTGAAGITGTDKRKLSVNNIASF